MEATWPVWMSAIFPILLLSGFLTLRSVFLFARHRETFLRDVVACGLPLIPGGLLMSMGQPVHLWASMILSITLAHTTRQKPLPLLLGTFLFFVIFCAEILLSPWASTSFGWSLLLGTVPIALFLVADERFGMLHHLVRVFTDEMEYRRQAMHLTVGVTMTLLLYYGILHTWVLGALIPVALILITLLKQRKLPLLEKALLVFERKHHFEKFPGRGSLCFLIGGFLACLLFSREIALASILVLAFGDSITNIAGGYYGRFPLPYNKKKNIEGPLAGALLASMAAALFVPFPVALAASLLAMFLETLPLKIGAWEIDDNITIPVVAGLVMTIL